LSAFQHFSTLRPASAFGFAWPRFRVFAVEASPGCVPRIDVHSGRV
jgi:hypothetical protein